MSKVNTQHDAITSALLGSARSVDLTNEKAARRFMADESVPISIR